VERPCRALIVVVASDQCLLAAGDCAGFSCRIDFRIKLFCGKPIEPLDEAAFLLLYSVGRPSSQDAKRALRSHITGGTRAPG